MPDAESASAGKLNVLSEDPLCAGVFLPNTDVPVSPIGGHFIRSHFPAPQIDSSSWSLPISGEVDNPIELSYADLLAMPSHEVTNIMECAGNSRSTMQPPAEGVQWDNGGLGAATWKGVPVKDVLEKAGLKSSATDVLFEGSDSGTEPHSGGPLNYAMSVPLEKLLDPDTILAYQINGETLPKDHGFPIRLLVPGWYGMASVKWLDKITVLDHPNGGFHEMDYRIYPAADDKNDTSIQRVTTLKVKSLIGSPSRGDILKPGPHKIKGVAWSGDGHITKVEISTDDCRSWHEAKLEEPNGNYTWQHFEYDWNAVSVGHSLLRCRATDSAGNVQPMLATWNFRGYQVNSIHSVPITVRRD
ncbi:MAG: sulfite oxidase [SAR202 cluster bacterium]|nr:sulfite oxidase [Chloroflexota bacterium]MQG33716.1 sulfite oxidase [SAR202 cluster bacterium]HCP24781.1 sulfite oxidase [Dehalococcoidia bacterium]